MLTCLAPHLAKKGLAWLSEACKGVHVCPAENCIVVAEGVLQHSGAFKVRALGFPPVELRGDSRAAAKVSAVTCCAAEHSSSHCAHVIVLTCPPCARLMDAVTHGGLRKSKPASVLVLKLSVHCCLHSLGVQQIDRVGRRAAI